MLLSLVLLVANIAILFFLPSGETVAAESGLLVGISWSKHLGRCLIVVCAVITARRMCSSW